MSVKLRIVERPIGVSQIEAETAAAVQRKRVFKYQIEQILRRVKQGCGLHLADGVEIDDEVLAMFKAVEVAWRDFCKEMMARRNRRV